MSTIFIIDDEQDALITLKAWCEKKGYVAKTFETADGFLDRVLEGKPELIFIDIRLRDDDGRHISSNLKQLLPFAIKIILISADARALLDYQHHYADGILNKPFTFSDFEKKIKQHLRK